MLALNAPGQLSYDSVTQLADGRTGHYNSWHPPLMAWRVYDVVRSIDWIETRQELHAARVGCMGISNGGECTIYAAALDTRIRAAFASGSLNTFRDSLMSYIH